jgi:hypothetical protein
MRSLGVALSALGFPAAGAAATLPLSPQPASRTQPIRIAQRPNRTDIVMNLT